MEQWLDVDLRVGVDRGSILDISISQMTNLKSRCFEGVFLVFGSGSFGTLEIPGLLGSRDGAFVLCPGVSG